MITEGTPVTNRYIDQNNVFNPASFIAGIIIGMLRSAGYTNKVETHQMDRDGRLTTVYLIKAAE